MDLRRDCTKARLSLGPGPVSRFDKSSQREKTMKAKTSKNVFNDLSYDAEEATNLRIRAALMVALTEHIRREDLTQKEAPPSS